MTVRKRGGNMTKEEALEILKNTLFEYSDLCEAAQIAEKALEKDIKQNTGNDVIFTGNHVHYELRNETKNFQMVTELNNQQSPESLKEWFRKNYSSVNFPKGKYAIVKVIETIKVEVVEELEEV